MYAVIATGGKQYRVQEGDTLKVEKLGGEAGEALADGASVTFGEVLMLAEGSQVTVGKPVIAGAHVTGQVVANGLGEKLIIYKYRRRKGYRRKTGHRQPFTAVKITGIAAGVKRGA